MGLFNRVVVSIILDRRVVARDMSLEILLLNID